MENLVDAVFARRRRVNKFEREQLRPLMDQPEVLAQVGRKVSFLLSIESASDSHALEDMFIFGAEVHDIVRRPLPLTIGRVTMPVVAFVYGFARESFNRVFEAEATAEVTRHLLPQSTPLRPLAGMANGSAAKNRFQDASPSFAPVEIPLLLN